MQLTLLGTGTSMGVPQIGCDCAVCRSNDPRDRRTRSGALVESAGSTLLIDTPPELRLQLLRAGTRHIDAVLYTHGHADHIHGIDDLRSFSIMQRARIPLHGPPATMDQLRDSFRYVFDDRVVPIAGTSKPRLTLHPLDAGTEVVIAGVPVLPLAFMHGPTVVYGYRLGPLGYITDAKHVDAAAIAQLAGVRVLVISALWWREHPTHLSIPEAIAVARAVGADRTVLTHLTHETGHTELVAQLPRGVEPGYDGLKLEMDV
jgi:phosphoribosyl 1,2-cyclic phosphate phosphodiesterase